MNGDGAVDDPASDGGGPGDGGATMDEAGTVPGGDGGGGMANGGGNGSTEAGMDGANDAAADLCEDGGTCDGGALAPVSDEALVSPLAVWAGDLDGDDIDDAVIASIGSGELGPSVHVARGRASGDLFDSAQRLPTGTELPLAVLAAQLDGVGGLDLVVFSTDFGDPANDQDSRAFLRVYLADGGTYPTTPHLNELSRVSQSWSQPRAPQFRTGLVVGTFDPARSVPGIAIGHHFGAMTFQVTEWASFSSLSPAPLLVDREQVSDLEVQPSAAGDYDDVVAFSKEFSRIWQLDNNGAGVFTSTLRDTEELRVSEVDALRLTPGGPLYGLGYGPEEVALAVELGGTDDPVSFRGESTDSGTQALRASLAFDSSAAGDGPPELVVAADSCFAVGSVPCLSMWTDLFIAPGSGNLDSPTDPVYWALPEGFAPRRILRGDFEGDDEPELIVISESGTRQCVRVLNSAFSACTD